MHWAFALWGLTGAFVYAAPFYVLMLWSEGQTKSGRWKATADFTVSLITGTVFALGWTTTAEKVVQKFVSIETTAIALTLGVAANYVWPKLLRRLGREIDSANYTKKQMESLDL